MQQLNLVAARARPLDERLSGAGSPRPAAEPVADRRLDAWARAYSGGDRAAFRRRLQWDGWDEERARSRLGDDPRAGGEPPAWVGDLAEVLADARATAEDLASGELRSAETAALARIPFAELWMPFGRWATRRLEALPIGDHLAAGARRTLELALLAELAGLGGGAAFERFSAVRQATGWAAGAQAAPDSRALYRGFTLTLLRGGLAGFFGEYSCLARQLVLHARDWVRSTRLLVARLAADRRELGELFAGPPFGRVEEIRTGLSDRHRGARVAALTFADGRRLIYKPRTIALEASFYRLLSWLPQHGLEMAPPAPRALARDGYGWVDMVETRPLADAAEAAAYFQRAGSLLCLAYVLGGDDLHAENVVATAAGPVLVDAETLLQPVVSPRWGARGARSVFSTQLLSSVQTDAAGRRFEAGGLSAPGGQTAEIERLGWRAVNSDGMTRVAAPAQVPRGDNLPLLEGEPLRPGAYRPELERGFAETWRFLRRQRDPLLAPDGPLAAMRQCPVRILFRPSQLYGVVGKLLATPRYQRTAPARAFLIDSLNRVFVPESERPALWPLTGDERRELDAGGIPSFYVGADETAIGAAGGERLEGYLTRSGWAAAVDLLGALDDEELGRQLDLIGEALGAAPAAAPAPTAAPEPVARVDFLRWAGAIGEILIERAARPGDNGPGWLLPEHAAGRPLSLALYDGAAGIALFLAALARCTGSPELARLCRAAAEPVLSAVGEPLGSGPIHHMGVGACSGIGGLVYALTGLGRLLDEPRYLEAASRAAARLERLELREVGQVDVADGLAGAVLGLLALAEATGTSASLELATHCGLLLRQRQADAGVGAGWRDPAGTFRVGFAHGASGIAHALLRLHRAAGGDDLLEAARRALAFERGAYSARAGNWPSATGDAPHFMIAWCNGACGVGLARLTALDALEREHPAADLERAVATTTRAKLGANDSACCGEMARVELLAEAARALGEPRLAEAAAARAAAVARRAERRGGYSFDSLAGPKAYDPGFFRGLSGVGYGLLRLAQPGLGSVLSFADSFWK